MVREINTQVLRLQLDLSAAVLWLVSAPFYALGWLAGFMVKCLIWIAAAVVAGYRAGVGQS
jgi:hypothetical protein